MKKINQKQIQKLTRSFRTGKAPKCPQLYRDLTAMAVGETYFISKEEWKSFGYKKPSFRAWWSITKNQNKRGGHKSSLNGIELDIITYEEGWVIKKLKAESKNN